MVDMAIINMGNYFINTGECPFYKNSIIISSFGWCGICGFECSKYPDTSKWEECKEYIKGIKRR